MAERTRPAPSPEGRGTGAEDRLAAWTERIGGEAERWRSCRPGPALTAVTARISAVPRAFLDERIHLPALAADTLGHQPAAVRFAAEDRVRIAAAIGLWLVASEQLTEALTPALTTGTPGLGVDALALRVAAAVGPQEWLTDAARRDEAARFFLFGCGFLPAGEDAATAADLLAASDSLARDAALTAAYGEQQHRAELRRRLEEARAREAAARYSHE